MTVRLDVHLFVHHDEPSDRVAELLAHILTRVNAVQAQETHVMTELDALTAQVHASDDVAASALVLINGIAARLAAAATDPAALTALSAELKTNSDALAAAVVANTPAAP